METIDSYISRLELAERGLSSEDKSELIKEVISVFSDQIPGIRKGLDRSRQRITAISSSYSPPPRTYDDIGDIRKLIGKLKVQRESMSKLNEDTQNRNTILITQTANPYMMQNQSTSLSVSISEVLDAVREDDYSEDDAKEIKALLLEAECNRGNESKLKEIGKKIADFAFDKAVSSLPSLLSFLASLF